MWPRFTMRMDYGKPAYKYLSMKKEKDQVALFKLVFTHNWEDPEADHAALKIKSNDSILAITSGGCNVLGFLLSDPEIIYSIDINPAQSWMLELKIAAIKSLDFDDFISFAGLKDHNNRLSLYEKIKPFLSKEALEFWNGQEKILTKGFLMNGKYERFIILAGKFLNFLHGKKRVRGLFMENLLRSRKPILIMYGIPSVFIICLRSYLINECLPNVALWPIIFILMMEANHLQKVFTTGQKRHSGIFP